MDFISCPTCQGEGRVGEKICPECQGRGLYSWSGGYLLYFEKKFKKSQIFLDKIKTIIQILIHLILFIFGLIGLSALIRVQFNLSQLDKYWSFWSSEKHFLMLIFWFSILTDCYLFYRFEQIAEEKEKVWPKTIRVTTTLPMAWPEIHRLSRKIKINAAEAFSQEVEKIFLEAWLLAKKLGHQEILPIHIFAAGLSSSNISLAINRLGLDWKKLSEKIAKVLASLSKAEIIEPQISRQVKEIVLQAYDLASEKKKRELGALEILQILVANEGPIKEILYDLEVGIDEIKNVCIWIDVYEELRRERQRFFGLAQFKPKGAMNRAMTAIATPYLDAYSQDLTQVARAGYLAPCMDREKEIDEIFRVIEGGQRGVVLVGNPGVGKTTIINGLAQRMVTEEVPLLLQDKRLVSLSLASLVAGASQPGEVEQRFQIIISEIVRAGNVVLFIPNIHNMIGVKTTEGELDISEVLADVLKKHLFIVLATTTPIEYRKYIENKSLGEVLQKVEIEEPGKNETIQILEANVALIEGREQIYFSYGALAKAVDLSTRYISERFLPDKAINLLKEVAIYVKNKRGRQTVVQAEDVAAIVAEKTSIPVTKITEAESEKLLRLEEEIHQRIIDQDEAVNMVASALRRARTELRDVKRPIVNLLFLGPTGVGKTELAKTVAEVYFGDENKMVRLDMSEYQTAESIYRLIGSPSSEEGGQLTEQIRQNPFTLLLLDEIEKAHPDILNVFLQIMDDGRLTDNLGRTIDFTNVILIGTSNAGTDFIQEEIMKGTTVLRIQEILIREKLKPYFRPEFLNRFDGVIVFKPLGKKEIKEIAKLLLNKLSKQLMAKGITLIATDEAIEELAEAGFDPIFGARPLRRVIQERVNNALANYLLTGKIGRRDIAILEKGGIIRVEKGREL
ncbi:MAG: AAA family ATPase [Patescibacteria group bacterium]